LGEEEGLDESDKPASSRLEASRMESRASWACRPRLRTLVAISLFPPAAVPTDAEVEGEVEVESDERVGVDEGACALSAESICAGVTVSGGVSNGFESDFVEVLLLVEARSMAPLRTSNKDLTSPV